MTKHKMAACLFIQIIVLACRFTIQLNRFVVTYLDINVNNAIIGGLVPDAYL